MDVTLPNAILFLGVLQFCESAIDDRNSLCCVLLIICASNDRRVTRRLLASELYRFFQLISNAGTGKRKLIARATDSFKYCKLLSDWSDFRTKHDSSQSASSCIIVSRLQYV